MLVPCDNCLGWLVEQLKTFFSVKSHTHTSEADVIPTTPVVGQIVLWAGLNAPTGWLPCDGATYHANTYSELYTTLGPMWWVGLLGDFNVPNLTDRFVIGASGTYPISLKGGEAEHTLSVSEMPEHSHDLTYTYCRGDGSAWVLTPSDYSSPDGTFSNCVSFKGNGDPHNNIPPYIALMYIIYAG